jgi:site-specific DNA-methyltransferase (adenine-specific)
MNVTDKITITNECNMELMKRYPDKYFDLAIVDPPYGINADKKNNGANSETHRKQSAAKINTYKTGWDFSTPNEDYFKELKRVSKEQIIWGVNYYPYDLSGGRIYWDKCVTMPTYSDGELAYCSMINSIQSIKIAWHGMIQHDMKNKEARIHPTQKPVHLYRALLDKYAQPNDKILDTHLGSGSIAIACHDYGFELTACELDKDYFEAAIKRIQNHVSQQKLFV